MAKIIYEVYQNQNEHSSAYGKWYGRVEMLLNSKKVKIEGLGTFYTTLECKKGGALTKDKFNINSNIDGLHIRFLPEQEQEQNISSRQFLKQAEFINVDSLLKKEEDENGGGSGRKEEDENGGGSGSGSGSGSQNSGSEQNGDSGNSGNSGEQNGGSQAETVAAPTISGETPFDESTQVTISGPEGAEIRYTVDGSAPTAESSLYSEALTLTDTVIVKAIAIKNGVPSEVASKTFTKNGSGDNGGGFDTGS